MSSTNRSDARNSHISDYYVTPQDCIREFFHHWFIDLRGKFSNDTLRVGYHPEKVRWLDPCAGGDSKNEMSYPSVIVKEFNPNVVDTLDIRETSLAEVKEDYLTWDRGGCEYDVIITNPPFNLARSIIEKALEDVSDGGYVIMLLRLNYFGSKDRFSFWKDQLPKWAYVHHRRMSFTDDGKTDSIEYMHAVWQKGEKPDFTMLKVI